jgi:hypothetical protein
MNGYCSNNLSYGGLKYGINKVNLTRDTNRYIFLSGSVKKYFFGFVSTKTSIFGSEPCGPEIRSVIFVVAIGYKLGFSVRFWFLLQ